MSAPATLLRDPDVLVDVASGRADRQRILREVEGRRWAQRHGVPTAATLAVDPDGGWIATRRLAEDGPPDRRYVESAWEVAERLAQLAPPNFVTPAATWRAPLRSRPVRALRLWRAGIAPARFVATRRAAFAGASLVTAHHDYHRENVLNTISRGSVTVLDWEFAGLGPRHADFLRLVVDLEPVALAGEAWFLALEHLPPAERRAAAALLRWLALRTYASEVDLPPDRVQADKVARRRLRWAAVRQWTADLAGEDA